MKIEIIIREIQKLQEERDLYYARSVEAENAKVMLEKQVSKHNKENEALQRQIKVLKADSDIKRNLYIYQQRAVDLQKKELSEKNAEIESLKKTCSSMQKKADDLQRKLDVKDRILKKKREEKLRIERECQNKNLLIDTLITEIGKPKAEGADLNIINPVDTIVVNTTDDKDQHNDLLESDEKAVHKNVKVIGDISCDKLSEITKSKKKKENIERPEENNVKEVSFYNIIQYENPGQLVERLHQLIDNKGGKAVGSVLLKCLQDKLITCKPSKKVVESEFNIKGAWSGIHKYMDENNQTATYHASLIKIF